MVHRKKGRAWGSWTLAKEYGFVDEDGRRPDWGGYFSRTVAEIIDRGPPLNAGDRFLLEMRVLQIALDPDRTDEAKRISETLDTETPDT